MLNLLNIKNISIKGDEQSSFFMKLLKKVCYTKRNTGGFVVWER